MINLSRPARSKLGPDPILNQNYFKIGVFSAIKAMSISFRLYQYRLVK